MSGTCPSVVWLLYTIGEYSSFCVSLCHSHDDAHACLIGDSSCALEVDGWGDKRYTQ